MNSKPADRSTILRKETSKTANLEIGAPREPSSLWHSRGYLPHFQSPDSVQHVTFHLADSLPKTILRRVETELKNFPASKRDIERRKRLEDWIDAGHGCCILREPAIAQMVQNSFLAFDGNRYRLLAWVVMPNHVHVLFEPTGGWTVAKTVASWKKFTARKICALPGSANSHISDFSGLAVPGSANLQIGGPPLPSGTANTGTATSAMNATSAARSSTST